MKKKSLYPDVKTDGNDSTLTFMFVCFAASIGLRVILDLVFNAFLVRDIFSIGPGS